MTNKKTIPLLALIQTPDETKLSLCCCHPAYAKVRVVQKQKLIKVKLEGGKKVNDLKSVAQENTGVVKI